MYNRDLPLETPDSVSHLCLASRFSKKFLRWFWCPASFGSEKFMPLSSNGRNYIEDLSSLVPPSIIVVLGIHYLWFIHVISTEIKEVNVPDERRCWLPTASGGLYGWTLMQRYYFLIDTHHLFLEQLFSTLGGHKNGNASAPNQTN